MKKFILSVCLFAGLNAATYAQNVRTISYSVASVDMTSNAVVSKKIMLQSNSTPQVKLTNIKTEPVESVPKGAKVSNSFEPDILLGSESKKDVVFVNVPVFRKKDNKIEKLVSFDIELTEIENPDNGNTAQKPTGVTNSILSTGTWYKIGAPTRGVYKITYAFLQSIGVNPANIDANNIRVYGNGGTVLPETVTPTDPDDLIENAVYVSSNGSTFESNDYILFYANGPTLWSNDTLNKSFKPTPNYYEDQSYYFLNFDLGAGKRITTVNANGTADDIVDAVDDYLLINNDEVNLVNIGKAWWGNKMNSINPASLTQTFPVNLGSVTSNVKASSHVATVCDQPSTINIKVNNAIQQSVSLPATVSIAAADAYPAFSFTAPGNAFNIQYTYNTAGTGSGYIDYLTLNYRKSLQYQNGQLSFRDWQTYLQPVNRNAAYNIQSANANLKVWEVSDPLNPVVLNGTLNGSIYTVVRPENTLREFIAFDGSGSTFNAPVKLNVSLVPNQNLHGLDQTDFLIISPAEFLDAANALATFHRQRDNMNVTVVQVDKIYNEFSSGGQDIAGIRNFIKMFYERSTNESNMIKNVLFMGAASFDYKNKIPFNTNFVPTFQTLESINTAAYSSDDFFSILKDGKNITNSQSLNDVGTGRIPAFTATEASAFVEKIKNYVSNASYGPWKNIVTYVADDRDDNKGMNHMADCEEVSSYFVDKSPIYNLYKIYCDAYTEVVTPSGGRYPMVNKAIDDQIYNGTFLMSYSGHGSPQRWADESILTSDDYSNWVNKNKLPVMVTATCDFGRFDDPEHRSAGAQLMINPDGGSIAMITTTQLVYKEQNTRLSDAYIKSQFSKDANNNWRTLGESLLDAKNSFSSDDLSNNRKYVVLGDPALKMQMPVHNVITDKLEFTDNGTLTETDTIKALGRYKLSGKVTDANSNLITDFNGPVYVTIFDKTKRIQVANPNQDETPQFNLQTNVVAKMKGTVINGLFSVTFVAPKDINYNLGFGKISYYANTDNTDAAGLDSNFTVGGYNTDAVADNVAPLVNPYIDDDKFRDGGVTGPNPLLYVKLFDENGINVSGTSIGHDLVAILDGDVQNPYIMNNYYQTLQNDFSNGYVNFPLYNLPDGKHTIKVTAWDTYNNSGEGTVTFEVKNQDKGFISDVYNYPNPVTDQTTFVLQHNQEGGNLDVSILIYSANGSLVKTLKQSVTNASNRTEIQWNGLGDHGVPLQKGVYFYKLNAKRTVGNKIISATAYQKLVMLR